MKQDNSISVVNDQSANELQPVESVSEIFKQMSDGQSANEPQQVMVGGGGPVATIVSAICGTASTIAECHAVCSAARNRTRQIQMMTDVQIELITAKYKSFELLLNKVFGEREKALGVYYKSLDKAIQSNDRELIASSIVGISGIVTKTPLEDLERLAHLYNDTSAPLLDF